MVSARYEEHKAEIGSAFLATYTLFSLKEPGRGKSHPNCGKRNSVGILVSFCSSLLSHKSFTVERISGFQLQIFK